MRSKRLIACAIVICMILQAIGMMADMCGSVYALGQVKNMTFYFHYTLSPPKVGGVVTNYIINSTKVFQTYKSNDFKGVGQPKIKLGFYMYPAFADSVQLDGSWQVIIFANSTALHPATWEIQFWEKDSSGEVLWSSGAISPKVLGGPSSNPGYVDSPVYAYTLSTSNFAHTFSKGSTLEVEITVNTGSTVPLRLWYDSSIYPSRLVLPSKSYALVSGIVTQDSNGQARNTFFTFWTSDQRKVIVQALVTDPFGGYDISKVWIQIVDPVGRVVVDNVTMQIVSGGALSYQNLYKFVYDYSEEAAKGTYNILVTVVDNNGQNQFQTLGYYDPFIEYGTAQFSIGIMYPVSVMVTDSKWSPLNRALVQFYSSGLLFAEGRTNVSGYFDLSLYSGRFTVKVWWQGVEVATQDLTIQNQTRVIIATNVYDVTFKIRSDEGEAVQGAMTFIQYPNKTVGRLPFLSDHLGSINLRQQPAGDFSLLIFFEGIMVADTTLNVNSNEPYNVETKIYKLTVNVTDSSGVPLVNATIIIRRIEGLAARVLDYGVTEADGTAHFSLPEGTYNIEAKYHTIYWLSYVSNTTRISLDLTSSNISIICMNNIPPPIWITIGFWLILIPSLLAIIGYSLYVVRNRRKKSKSSGTKIDEL